MCRSLGGPAFSNFIRETPSPRLFKSSVMRPNIFVACTCICHMYAWLAVFAV
jgi:hypothetical protein